MKELGSFPIITSPFWNQREQGGGKEQMLSHHYILHRLIPVFITDVLVASGDRTLTDGIFEVEWNDS